MYVLSYLNNWSHSADILMQQVFGSYDRATILCCKYDEDSNVDYMIVFKSPNNLEQDTFRTWLKKFAEVNKINNNVRLPIRIKKYWNVLNSKLYASFELEQKNAFAVVSDYGTPVPDYTDENVSTKVVKIIQSYVAW